MKITKDLLRKIIKEELQESFRLEKDFQPGTPVNWNVLAKVMKTTASGREKVDFERMMMSGEVLELITSPGAALGVAIVRDPDGNTHEIELSELILA
jgi:polynucleotide 5'-kinase involved in rRNA processing